MFDTPRGGAEVVQVVRRSLTFDGERPQLGFANVSPEGADLLRRRYPMAPGRVCGQPRNLTRSAAAIPDAEDSGFEMKVSRLAWAFAA